MKQYSSHPDALKMYTGYIREMAVYSRADAFFRITFTWHDVKHGTWIVKCVRSHTQIRVTVLLYYSIWEAYWIVEFMLFCVSCIVLHFKYCVEQSIILNKTPLDCCRCCFLDSAAQSVLDRHLNQNQRCPNAFIEQEAWNVPMVWNYRGVFLLMLKESSFSRLRNAVNLSISLSHQFHWFIYVHANILWYKCVCGTWMTVNWCWFDL